MCGIVCVWFISTWTFVFITRTCHRGAATAFISTILSYNRFRSVSFLGTSSTASWTTLPRAPWSPLAINWEMRIKVYMPFICQEIQNEPPSKINFSSNKYKVGKKALNWLKIWHTDFLDCPTVFIWLSMTFDMFEGYYTKVLWED